MPKGVEHRLRDFGRGCCSNVIHSLMPKGVEHMDKVGGFVSRLGRDSFVDAERR